MSSAQKSISTAQSAVVDRRAHNIRYRQNELLKLHAQLREHENILLDAIIKDSDITETEARVQYIQLMEAIRENYEQLDNDTARKEEYMVATGNSHPKRRISQGLVVIRPTTFTRLYSVLQPLASAIAAGNCVVIELPNTTLAVDAPLKDIIRFSLDPDAYPVVEINLGLPELPKDTFLIDQTQVSEQKVPGLYSDPNARTLVVVDRTAQLSEAAKYVAQSRMIFSGKSPYAPDLVLVNEFIKAPFVEALVKSANAATAGIPSKGTDRETISTLKVLKNAEKAGECSILHSSSTIVVEVLKRDSALLERKITGACIKLVSVRSLTDAVSFHHRLPNLLAGYYFADQGAGKFLSHSISAEASFINHIPHSLHLGPAAPSTFPVSLARRYTTEMLTKPRPEYAQANSKQDDRIATALIRKNSSLLHNLVKPLKPTGQRSGSSVGFFDQGIFTGLTFFVLPFLATTGYITYLGGHYLFSRLVNMRN